MCVNVCVFGPRFLWTNVCVTSVCVIVCMFDTNNSELVCTHKLSTSVCTNTLVQSSTILDVNILGGSVYMCELVGGWVNGKVGGCMCVCVCWGVHSCHLIFWSFCTKNTVFINFLIIYSNTNIANGWVDFSWSHTFLVTSLNSKILSNTLNFADVSHVHTNLHHQLFVNVFIDIWICIVNACHYSSGSPHTDEFTSPTLCKHVYKYLNLYHWWQKSFFWLATYSWFSSRLSIDERCGLYYMNMSSLY